MLTYPQRQEIGAAIEAVRRPVVEAALIDQYRNPFWEDRYGERGHVFSNQDNHYHLDFLIAAIKTDNQASFSDTIQWLQILLVHRGMCSRHICQNLDSLKDHLQAALPQHWENIAPYWQAGYRGLEYEHPACRALEAQAESIANAATRRIYGGDSFWMKQYGERGQVLCHEDNLFHLSYLEDAIGASAEHIFGKYLAWLTGFMAKRGIVGSHIQIDLHILAEEIAHVLPAELANPFDAILSAVTQPV